MYVVRMCLVNLLPIRKDFYVELFDVNNINDVTSCYRNRFFRIALIRRKLDLAMLIQIEFD